MTVFFVISGILVLFIIGFQFFDMNSQIKFYMEHIKSLNDIIDTQNKIIQSKTEYAESLEETCNKLLAMLEKKNDQLSR